MSNHFSTITTSDHIIGEMDHRIKHLQQKFPCFDAQELEILVRCHEQISTINSGSNTRSQEIKEQQSTPGSIGSFILQLAKASPYQLFLLPGDELTTRLEWLQQYILPQGFDQQLRTALLLVTHIVKDSSIPQEHGLEYFINQVANVGRRGNKVALEFFYHLVKLRHNNNNGEAKPLVDTCVRLAIAVQVLVAPNMVNRDETMQTLQQAARAVDAISALLDNDTTDHKPLLTCEAFVNWAEAHISMLHTPLTTFLYTLLFHGHQHYQEEPRCTKDENNDYVVLPSWSVVPYYQPPHCHSESRIFGAAHDWLLTLALTQANLGSEWYRIYSSFQDGRSFNRLEYAISGYSGPTIIAVETTAGQVLGGYTEQPWKDVKGAFYGNDECFLFALFPEVKIYRPQMPVPGKEQHYMYLHMSLQSTVACHGHPHGLGLGGTLEHPRFFIPETLEHCWAGYLDKTFEQGPLLPLESLERFEIKTLEVWGVGGTAIVEQALSDRAAHRERRDEVMQRARSVHDKKHQFATDLQSGLLPSRLYSHRQEVRGGHQYIVDDRHGGNKTTGQ